MTPGRKPDLDFAWAGDAYIVAEDPNGQPLHVMLLRPRLTNYSESPHGALDCLPVQGPGLYMRFKCVCNEPSRSYFFARAAPERTGEPKEYDWAVEYTGRDGRTKRDKFSGRLYDHKERKRGNGKWEFFGTIKISRP